MYFPEPQSFSRAMTFVMLDDGDPASLAPAVRERVRAVDPNLPLSACDDGGGRLRCRWRRAAPACCSSRCSVRWRSMLAAAGIHGVMSHLVALRSAEIGVRMTLGARPSSVMALMLREGTLQALAGLAIGLTGGVLLMRTFQSVLFGVQPADALTLSWLAVGLLLTALAACAIPARRAMRIDPVEALRQS